MNHAILSGAPWPGTWMTAQPQLDRQRRKRILQALGLPGNHSLRVDEETLTRYYDYLAARLDLPFTAFYPPPSGSTQTSANRCEVMALLDPRTDICDTIDGLYCQTRRGRFLVNLPLVELTILPPSKNIELVGDYEYWFWHWRG